MKKLLSVLLLISSVFTFVCPISSFASNKSNTSVLSSETTNNDEKNQPSFSQNNENELTVKISDISSWAFMKAKLLNSIIDLAVNTIKTATSAAVLAVVLGPILREAASAVGSAVREAVPALN